MDRTIVHFEIPANDPEKLSAFYKSLFGWTIQKDESIPQMSYWIIQTKAKEDDAGVNGGIYTKADPNQRPVNYINVESIAEYSNKISQLGGKITMPKMEVPGHGWLAVALDPEGNAFGLWESTQK